MRLLAKFFSSPLMTFEVMPVRKNCEKIQGFLLYKIFYGERLVYLGRTKQQLQDRIRGHLLKQPKLREISIDLVTRIEYAEFKTEADMNLYEIYFILTLRPPLNRDDKAADYPTVSLPEVEWRTFNTHLWTSWRAKVKDKDAHADSLQKLRKYHSMKKSDLRAQRHNGEISEDLYFDLLDEMVSEAQRAEGDPTYVMSVAQETDYLGMLKAN